MTIANEILKAQNNLKDCYDVCKSVDGVVLPEDKNFDNLPALIEQALNPFNKPADWSDIRKDCPANSIALYAAHSSDYATAGYQQIGTVPYTLVGNPTITNGVMSGFSTEGMEGTNNYAFINELPTETIKSFRIKVKFKLNSLPASGVQQVIFGQKNSNKNSPQLYIDGTLGQLHYSHPLGSSWGNYIASNVSANTTYWAIVEWNNKGKTQMLTSTDGVSYSLVGTATNNSVNWTGYTSIGADYYEATQLMTSTFDGSIYLNETSIEINNKAWFKYGSKITAVNNNNLYLESSGTQYIDTGVIPSNDIGFDLDYEIYNDMATTNWGSLLGSRVAGASSNFQITSYSSAEPYSGWFRFGDQNNSAAVGMVKNTRQQISFRNLTFTNASGTTSNLNTYTWNNSNNIILFAANDNGNITGKCSGKIYRCKLYDGDTLIRDLVPVKQGMIIGNFTVPANGMWDLVNQEYYPNFGTGDFTYGGASAVQYDNLGFTATCTGGYNVFIDGVQYGSTYASGSQCNITWSNYTATAGESITTPSALTAHKIWVEPATSGNNITAFHLDRVAASGTEAQGLLWAHFNLTNQITPAFLAGRSGQYTNAIAKAITAKNNVLNVSSSMNSFVFNATALEYIPVIDGNNETVSCASSFAGTGNLSKIVIKNFKMSAANSTYLFYNSKVKEIVFKNVDTSSVSNFTYFFGLAPNIKKLPNGMDYSSATTMPSILQNNTSLQDTVLDVSSATGLTRLGCYGSSASNFVGGLKGLRVSSEAPFDFATPPQITVQYTGMDRAALVQLFNDLPYNVGYEVVGSPTINNGVISNMSASDYAKLSLTVPTGQAKKFKIKTEFTTPNEFTRVSPIITVQLAYTFGLVLQKEISTKATLQGMTHSNGSYYSVKGTISGIDVNTKYYAEYIVDGENGTQTLKISTDGTNWQTFTGEYTVGQYNDKDILWQIGKKGSDYSECSIGIGNTQIDLNDVPFFRGQPAMTKTLSCVGATGTADLTAEDKDIALNKGWSLTLS